MKNPKNFIQGLLWIKTKEGKLVRFKFNEVQRRIYDKILELKALGKPIRLIILKARQTGISTLTEALIFYYTITQENITSFIIAHDKESTQHLFRMSKLYYDRLPQSIKPMKKASNRIELLFDNPSEKTRHNKPGLNSILRVDTAGNPQAGRAYTVQNLHCSEIAFWEKPADVMTGLAQSVPDSDNTMVIIESTANGMGNYFYDMWHDAQNGDNDYIPIFIAWFELEEYRLEIPKDFTIYDYEHEIYGNESALKIQFDLDDEQIYWRRKTIKNKCNNDPDKFKQEYPATAAEAFLVSGRNVFNINLIQKYYEFVRVPERGELSATSDYKEFKQQGRGELRIWEHPEPTNRYSIGVDVAEGFAGGDYSCAEVFDVKNYEQVAEWHGHIPQQEFAYVLKHLAEYYNEAIVVVESNQGQVVLSYLKPIYYRLYYRREEGKRTEKRTRELGFRTTSRSKQVLIGTFKTLFEEEEIIINGKEALHEMSVYVEEDPEEAMKKDKRNLRMGAQGKEHDDRIMAIGLALLGIREVPIAVQEKSRREYKYKPSNSITGY